MTKIVAAFVFVVSISTVCLADIPPPETAKDSRKNRPLDTNLSIRLDGKEKEARLIIPRSQLKQLRAELETLDEGIEDTASAGGSGGVRTVVGGALLSLAFVTAGFWFVKPRRGTATALLAIVAAGGGFATLVFGNVGPPPSARSITGKMFSASVQAYGYGSGKIKLEASDTVRTPTLIVPDPEDAKTGE